MRNILHSTRHPRVATGQLGIMQTMRQAWTDERLDDLNHKVDEMNREMHAEFRSVRAEIKSMQMVMIGGFGAMFATMVSGFIAILA